MEDAFWDSSSLVPLCVTQPSTPVAERLSALYGMVVWWATPIEMLGAFARLVRMGRLTSGGQTAAQLELENFRQVWQEVDPSNELREQAGRLLDRFPLKAADAQQLAAALIWCLRRPAGRAFISGDSQLLEAARELGFLAIKA